MKLAKEQNKLSGGVNRVILFKDQCQFSNLTVEGNQEEQGDTKIFGVNSGQQYQNPVQILTEITKKNFEFDFQIKRIVTVTTNLKEDAKQTDKQLDKLEGEIEILRQKVEAKLMQQQ